MINRNYIKKALIIIKAPKSFVVRLYKLSKIFGFFPAFLSLIKLLRKPLNPSNVVVSAYHRDLKRDIYFRPGTSDVGILEQVFIREDYNYYFDIEPVLLIDAGAHCGFASIYLRNKFPEIKIIAIEPEPRNFSMLKKNMANVEGAVLINKALTDTPKKVELTNPDAKNPSFTFGQSKTGTMSVTINKIIEKYGSNYSPRMLKLDIEGAEKDIFTHNPETWINEFDLIFTEPHDWIHHDTEKTIVEVAKRNNKKIEKIGENIVLTK